MHDVGRAVVEGGQEAPARRHRPHGVDALTHPAERAGGDDLVVADLVADDLDARLAQPAHLVIDGEVLAEGTRVE